MLRLVDAAIKVGELTAQARPARLARTIEAVLSGSMFSWAFYREGRRRPVDAYRPGGGAGAIPARQKGTR